MIMSASDRPDDAPMGRPTSYRKEYVELARNYCLLGATNKILGEYFGVTDRTITTWMLQYDEFDAAVKSGRAKADSEVAASCFKRAVGYSYVQQHINKKGDLITLRTEMPPDVHAQIFWLTRRQRDLWAANPDTPIDDRGMLAPIGSAALVEAARRIAFILARATQGEAVTVEPKEVENVKSTKG